MKKHPRPMKEAALQYGWAEDLGNGRVTVNTGKLKTSDQSELRSIIGHLLINLIQLEGEYHALVESGVEKGLIKRDT